MNRISPLLHGLCLSSCPGSVLCWTVTWKLKGTLCFASCVCSRHLSQQLQASQSCSSKCWLPLSVLSFCLLGGSHGLRMESWLLGGIGWKFKEHEIRSILRQSLRRQIYETLLKFHIMLRLSSEKSETREGRKSGRKGGRVRERYLVCYLSLFCIVESFTNLMHKLINGILLSNPLWLPSLTS